MFHNTSLLTYGYISLAILYPMWIISDYPHQKGRGVSTTATKNNTFKLQNRFSKFKNGYFTQFVSKLCLFNTALEPISLC